MVPVRAVVAPQLQLKRSICEHYYEIAIDLFDEQCTPGEIILVSYHYALQSEIYTLFFVRKRPDGSYERNQNDYVEFPARFWHYSTI